jgi:hypothetical protein
MAYWTNKKPHGGCRFVLIGLAWIEYEKQKQKTPAQWPGLVRIARGNQAAANASAGFC